MTYDNTKPNKTELTEKEMYNCCSGVGFEFLLEKWMDYVRDHNYVDYLDFVEWYRVCNKG
jgi:hypothetical protein